MLEQFFKTKREEYEYAKRHNLKALQQAIRQCVKKTAKLHQVKIQPTQLELF